MKTLRRGAARAAEILPETRVSVSVCGVVDGMFTATGLGFQYFESLAAARDVFPELNPDADTARFTRATTYPDGRHLRFDTHRARAFYSA